MMKLNSIIIGLIFTLSQLTFAKGNESSGGGNAVRCTADSQPVLLDLLYNDLGFKDQPTNDTLNLQETKYSKVMGYDRFLSLEDSPAYQLLSSKLENWKDSSPIVYALLKDALRGMNFLITPYRQAPAPGSVIPEKILTACPQATLESIVVYDINFGARISIPVFNQLGLLSQEGLLLHEALRHIQIAYGDKMSDENIFELTALILFQQPSKSAHSKSSLDQERFFNSSVKERIVAKNRESSIDLLYRTTKNIFEQLEAVKKNLPYKPKDLATYTTFESQLKLHLEEIYQNKKIERDQSDLIHKLLSQWRGALGTLKYSNVTTQVLIESSKNNYSLPTHPESEHINKIQVQIGLLIQDYNMAIITECIDSLASRTHLYVDLTRKINMVWLEVSEQQLRNYINGNKKGISFRDRTALNKAILKSKKYHEDQIKNGQLLPAISEKTAH